MVVSARTPDNAKLQVKEMKAQKLSLISIVTCINNRRACVNILQTETESCGLLSNTLLNIWIALSLDILMVFSVFFLSSFMLILEHYLKMSRNLLITRLLQLFSQYSIMTSSSNKHCYMQWKTIHLRDSLRKTHGRKDLTFLPET